MLVSQTVPDCRTSCPSTMERGFSSRLDLYVDLGIRPSSFTLFSELGIDLYVDLGVQDPQRGSPGDSGFTPETNRQETELRLLREDSNFLPKRFDPMSDLNVDYTHQSLEQTEKLVPPVDKLTAETSVAETCTVSVEAEVEEVEVAATRLDKHDESVGVFSLCNVESGADPAASKRSRDLHTFQLRPSNTTDILQDTRGSQAVESDAALAIDAWEDAEIVAIRGLTELRDEVRFEQEKRSCSSMEVEVSNSKTITVGLDRKHNSAVFPGDELYHLRLHLECLSRRVRRCQAQVEQLKLDSDVDVDRAKPLKVHLFKRGRKYKPKRSKLLCSRSHPIDCGCMKKSLKLTFQSVRNFL